ncbi:ribonuclease P protein subunit p30 [Bombyx mandarina]|uniref:Ribonuclease P protein subunit p30 n=1 Tax=Bombyx mandarina TaxID=7092 RepID=A0A6J2JHW4_BOMMA|nr:ribonuclease P protein subunit p30 [Bombyx mandarina]
MSSNWGFCDLSISKNYDIDKLHIIEKLGFNTIAINTCLEEGSDEPKKKKKKGDTREIKDFVPPPMDLPKDNNFQTKLNILQRITIEFSDSGIVHKLNRSENIKKYDIIAVIPKTLQAFQYACSSMDIDIISFETEGRIPFKVHRKLYKQAVDRGIFFEIMYSPIIRDSTARKNIISNAHVYHTVGKSKNIILTSGADNHMYIRSVNDIINLGFLLGLNHNESLEVVRNNTRRLILKTEGRKCGKHYMSFSPIENKINEDYFGILFL